MISTTCRSDQKEANAGFSDPHIRAAFLAICTHNSTFSVTGGEQAQVDALFASLNSYCSFKGLKYPGKAGPSAPTP